MRSLNYPGEGISDVLARGPIIQVLTVAGFLFALSALGESWNRIVGVFSRRSRESKEGRLFYFLTFFKAV